MCKYISYIDKRKRKPVFVGTLKNHENEGGGDGEFRGEAALETCGSGVD